MATYFVYILKSLRDGNYYIGMTADLEKRVKCHCVGSVKSTRNRRPLRLIYPEHFDSINEARSRETYLKSYKGAGEKREIINRVSDSE